MPAPVLASFAQRLYDSLLPVRRDDAQHGYALALYCAGLGSMFQIVDDYSRDQVVGNVIAPGWSQLLDADRAPDEALAWLGQWVGVRVTAGSTPANQRLQIKSVGGWKRGTPGSLVAAIQATLTGTKSVTVIERNGGPYNITVITKASETPSPSASLAAAVSQKAAGLGSRLCQHRWSDLLRASKHQQY
jgi:hypothetical protein